MSDSPESAAPKSEEGVWPPAPTPQESETPSAPKKAPREAPDWAALVPGIVVVLFLLLCFLITLWFLGKLEHL